jgi:NAD(P)H-hydrate epimerase
MRELDRRATQEFAIPSLLLMENAGRGAADVAAQMATPQDGSVIVYCGRGNNGGDGLVVARHLANRGFRVMVYLACSVSEIQRGTDPWTNLEIVWRMGLPILEHPREADRDAMGREVFGAALLVDGLLGTGLAGQVREPYATLVSFLNARRAPILALDLPSGLDADTGEILGRAVHAKRTATFGAPKVGFSRGQGPDTTGPVTVIDISLPRRLLEE